MNASLLNLNISYFSFFFTFVADFPRSSNSGPVNIEEVVPWSRVVDRYLAMKGLGDGITAMDIIPAATLEDVNETAEVKQNGDLTSH